MLNLTFLEEEEEGRRKKRNRFFSPSPFPPLLLFWLFYGKTTPYV
jgi:hypothetical protein